MTYIDEQHEEVRAKGGGATIDQSRRYDPRLSKLFAWGLAFLGTAATVGAFTVANNLYELNLTVAQMRNDKMVMIEQIKELQEGQRQLQRDARQLERDVSTIEGKVFRGVDGYGPQKESARGR